MMRVLLLGNDEDGIYVFRRELIEVLVAHNFEVIVGFPFSTNFRYIQKLGCEIENTKINRHGTSIVEDGKLLFKYIKLLKKYRPSVVLLYTIKPNIYASLACQLYDIPYINNITGLGAALQGNSFLSRFVIFLQRLGYRKSCCVFFQNSDNLSTLLRLRVVLEKTPTRLVPGSGVNLSLYRAEPFPAQDGIVRFVTIARIQREKGFNELFEVAQRIKAKYSNTEFHVVGNFEEVGFENDVELLKQAKVIIYHGEISQKEVHRLIAQCNCLVHPSYHEGMSNVCLEAAATGRPIIASDIPGCRETFDEGVSGYGFKVGDADALYEAIEKFIHTPIEKQVEMGQRGRLKVEREFDRQIVVDAYLDEIQKITRKAS